MGQATESEIEANVEAIPFYDFVNNADSIPARKQMMLVFFKQEVQVKLDEVGGVYKLRS